MYIHVYQIIENRGQGPFNSLRHTDNRNYFLDLSIRWNWREAHMVHLVKEVGKFGDALTEKKVTLT